MARSILIFTLSLWMNSFGLASEHECSFCSEDQGAITRFSCDHLYCTECLTNWVENYLEENRSVTKIQKEGLPCRMCNGSVQLANIEPYLPAATKSLMQRKLEAEQLATAQVRSHIEDLCSAVQLALIVSCPNTSCHERVDTITDACNKATCPSCKTNFCMFCLAIEASSDVLHRHVASHQGNLFTRTNIELYHWLIYREKFAFLFQMHAKETIMAAIDSSKPLKHELRQAQFWPMPVGKSLDSWIDEVMRDQQLTRQTKIAMLQCEGVYLHRKNDGRARAKLTPPLAKLGAHYVASFDAQDIRQAQALPLPIPPRPRLVISQYYANLIRQTVAETGIAASDLEAVYQATFRLADQPDEAVHLEPRAAHVRHIQHLFGQILKNPTQELLFTTHSEGNEGIDRHIVVAARPLFLTEDMREALRETAEACDHILAENAAVVALRPQSAAIRQLQHLLANQLGLVTSTDRSTQPYVVVRRL